ncbi:MAG: hypothetical protein AAF754_15195, partial [Pseudomonadota bacterium]
MADKPGTSPNTGSSTKSSDSEKEKIASQLSRSQSVGEDDSTRATLHTGDTSDGKLSEGPLQPGAPETYGSPIDPGTTSTDPMASNVGDAPAPQPLSQPSDADAPASKSQAPIDTAPEQNPPVTPATPQASVLGQTSGSADPSAAPATHATTPGSQHGTPKASDTGASDPGNRAAIDMDLDNSVVAEGEEGAVIGKLSVIDLDYGDSHTFEVSDDRFEVVDGELKLKDGIALDHEEAAALKVEVTATDAGGLSYSETFKVEVADVNEAPAALTLNGDSTNLIKNYSFEEFDLAEGKWKGFDEDASGGWKDQNGIEVWDRLGGTQASDGDQLVELDHTHAIDSISQDIQTQDGQVYDLSMDLRERLTNGTDTVEVLWNGELIAELDPQSSDWESFDMQVVGTGMDTLELREAAGESDSYGALIDNITLVAAENTIAENVEGAVVGQLSFTDPDAGDTHSFEVSDDRFEVVEGQLKLKDDIALDHEEAAALDVDVTVTDAGGLSTTETFTLTVADVNEVASDIQMKGSKIAENDAGAVVGKISVVDPDAGDAHTFEVSDDRFEVVDGELKLKDGIALDHEEAAALKVEVTATDAGGLSYSETFKVEVT